MAADSSSSPQFFGIREDEFNQMKQQQTSTAPTNSSTAPTSHKKKRNLPGTPYPDAEVIALSPKTLMATNRFICEVCNKGFQREQNLQLHRRGHNLPWKLKQKSSKEVRRKVYLCPEPTCAHHDPSRALGDLTGIKKHFCRKHGEKKWKCDKCSKRYAVQSDWKAHSKTCGTREYRCDCGTLFSRRDSFITHRAFCDALAHEGAGLPSSLNTIADAHHHGLYSTAGRNAGLALSGQLSALQDHPPDLLRLGGGASTQFDHLLPPNSSAAFFLPNLHHDVDGAHNKPFSGSFSSMPANLHAGSSTTSAAGLFNLGFFSNNNSIITDHLSNGTAQSPAATFFSGGGGSMIDAENGGHAIYNEPSLPQMSATALLHKAAQMGATTSSSNGGTFLRAFGGSTEKSVLDRPPSAPQMVESDNVRLHNLMSSLANGGSGHGLTRDFLGVGGIDMRSLDGGAGGDSKFRGGGLIRHGFGGGTAS